MKRFIPILILIFIAAAGYQWYNSPAGKETSDPANGLFGSGSIEAETIAITAELGGRITDITVEEGQEVTAGQVLVELDKADLLAQKEQLETAVALARANLELVSAPPRPEEITLAQTGLTQARTTQDGAHLTWQQIQRVLDNPHELEAKINQAQAQMTQAESNLEQARVNLKRAEIRAEAESRDQSSTMALAEANAAQKQFEAARIGVQMAEVALKGAQQQREHLIRLREQPLQLVAQANTAEAVYQQTGAAVLVADANLAAVLAGTTAEDMAIARAQVEEAETALRLIDVQLAKQTLTAPRAGLVSQRLVEPGELAAPGKVLLELSDIDSVDLVVYIPETEIGKVKIGQPARVYVDAYDAEVFNGVVSFIAHEAEFTPKNVQTKEERVNLMFAVKITLANANHRLKPGMPADALILVDAPVEARELPSPTPRPQPTVIPTAIPTVVAVESGPAVEPTPTRQATEPDEYAEVLAWTLRVRRGPGAKQPALTSLSRGATVPILQTDPASGWLQVQLPSGEIGWISGSPTYVVIKSNAGQSGKNEIMSDEFPTGIPSPSPEASATPAQAEIISVGLNVRQGPGVEYPIVANLARGYTMPIMAIDPDSGWLQVELPGYGQTGWISGDPAYVSVK